MRVLTFTSLFPNQTAPTFCAFVPRRLEAWASRHGGHWAVVAPVPYFPKLPFRTPWAVHAAVPTVEKRGAWTVLHPRYLMLPKIGTRIQGASMAAGAGRAVSRLQRGEGPFDLIDAHFVYPDGYAAMVLAERLGIPFVVSARGSDINLYPDLPGIRPKIQRVLRAAGAVIGVSASLVERMVSLGASPEKCHVVGNGVDLQAFRPPDKAGTINEQVRLLAVGNLVPEKGFDLLLEAIARIEGERKLRLTIVGSGPEESNLRDQVQRLGLESIVDLAGRMPHDTLPQQFREADVFCLSSRMEGCPNVVMEALASGIPVCATPVGGVPDLVTDGVNGMPAPEVSSEGIQHAIERVLAGTWTAEQVRSTVSDRSWESVADRLQGIFEPIISDRR